jgi:hypothetical protein
MHDGPVVSDYRQQRQKRRNEFVTNEKRQALQPAQVTENKGEPWRARTSDPLIKSALTETPAGYGSYDLLTFVTGCSRQRVHLLLPSQSSLSVVLSQVCLNLTQES